jgi:hypothetical protein
MVDTRQRLLRLEPETHKYVVAPDQPRKSKRRTYAAKAFRGGTHSHTGPPPASGPARLRYRFLIREILPCQ